MGTNANTDIINSQWQFTMFTKHGLFYFSDEEMHTFMAENIFGKYQLRGK